MKCILVLETGKIFYGQAFGACGETWGEVVFNTGMTGYQEVLTDPSYADQIVCMTYPLIGNYGINLEDDQSKEIQAKGFIVKEAASQPNHWQMQEDLAKKLAAAGIVGISGIDTRALTKHIREYGVVNGAITNDQTRLDQIKKEIKTWRNTDKVVPLVSTRKIVTYPAAQTSKQTYHVAAIDFGIKNNILRTMQAKGLSVTLVPFDTSAEQILALKPDGVFLSNGPGDPKAVPEGIATIKNLMGKIPIFGICLGHQLLTLACGGDTYKLKFGHRGGNQPVQDIRTGKVTITSQNHGYALDENSLHKTPLQITHYNLNDRTVEGVVHQELPVFSVQYHPEAGPGPSDSLHLFDDFIALMAKRGTQNAS